jgi:hypothetical protein
VNRKHKIPKGFKFADTFGLDDNEWDEEAAAREAREAKKALRAEAHKLRSRMQQCFSPKRLASLARDRWWLKRYDALEKFEQQTAKEEASTDLLLKAYRSAMLNQMEQTWLAAQWVRVKKAAKEISQDICRAERKELLRRGVVRGRRK